ncbi:hypothetical protein DOTSEDRAFT_74102 [Dothistroma septosporum NZE10]|uniref:Uncharacterized protein n=1 Tax=Dothistroma septosporum (strain NZE10 / CBS 128990) TaxID=675120 RepID=N1PK61_DOTSN|nr:hypothetical protein DOTSEDRAFT_74102 [Dothistroma septosporum NZE10]
MAAELSLIDPRKKSHRRDTSSIGSIRSDKSAASKASTSSQKSVYCDLLGVRTKEKEPANHTSTSRLSQVGSIASGATGSSSSSDASTITNASSKSSTSMTEHDVFGTKLPPTEEELAPSAPDAVELESGKYKIPEIMNKQFFKDLTCLEDEELIGKYGLTPIREEATGRSKKQNDGGIFKRMVRGSKIGSATSVKATT